MIFNFAAQFMVPILITAGSGLVATDSWQSDAVNSSRFLQDKKAHQFISSDGRKVVLYLVDSGVNLIEPFKGYKIRHKDFTDDVNTANRNKDCTGHGTSVLGSIIGPKGVLKVDRKRVEVVSLKIFGCDGSSEGVEEVLDWVSRNHKAGTVGVINMSLGGADYFEAENQMRYKLEPYVAGLLETGVISVASAGNSSVDSCSQYPSNVKGVVAVGALKRNFKAEGKKRKYTKLSPYSYSNYGDCVDVWMFGQDIDTYNRNGKDASMSGTSYAAPLVSGILLSYLSSSSKVGVVDALMSLDKNSRVLDFGGAYGEVKIPYIAEAYIDASAG
jgi:subtilisin family serine protease